MGRRGRSILTGEVVMFVTTSLIDWEPLFAGEATQSVLDDLLFEVAASKGVVVFGYCIMPTHVHLLIGHSRGGRAISEYMQSFKSLASRRLFPGRHNVWQRRFDDVLILTEETFRTKLNYIHQNPVKAGLVSLETGYVHSSAAVWLGVRVDPRVCTSLDNWSAHVISPSHEDV